MVSRSFTSISGSLAGRRLLIACAVAIPCLVLRPPEASATRFRAVSGSPFHVPGDALTVEFSPSGHLVAVGSGALYPKGSGVSAVTFFAVRRSGALRRLPGSRLAYNVDALRLGAFDPAGRFIAIFQGHGVSLFTVGRNGLGHRVSYRRIPGGTGAGGAKFSPDGRFLTLNGSGTVHPPHGFFWIFRVSPSGRLTDVPGTPFSLDALAGWSFSPNGRYIATITTDPWGVALYPLGSQGAPAPKRVDSLQVGNDLRDIAFSPNGGLIALPQYGFRGLSAVWMISVDDSGSLSRVPDDPFPTRPGGWPEALDFSPDGRFVAAAESDSPYTDVYDVESGGRLHRVALLRCGRVPPGSLGLKDVAFSPKGRLLAVANFVAGTVVMFRRR